MQRFAWVFGVLLILASQLPASPCVSGDTLANYVLLGAGGCTIGPQTVNDFSFSVLSVGGGATALTASDITVTPTFGVNAFGAQFANAGNFTLATGNVSYLIGFTWDSLPIRGMDDVLDPGDVNVLTNGCEGAAFTPSCAGTPVNVAVNFAQQTDSAFFSPVGILGISDTISESADQGTASFSYLENDALVTPEPASFLFVILGVTIIAAGILWKRSTSTVG